MRRAYHWVIAICSFLVLFITNGIIVTGITAFDPALLSEFGWSRSTLKFRDLLTFAVAGLLAPFGGALADRFGVRPLMLIGAALLSVCLVAYSRIDSAASMYVVHTLFAVVLVSCGLVVAVLLTSRWFKKRRGTALGFVIVGTSLGGVVFPLLNTYLIGVYGWRTAMLQLIAAPVLLLAVVATLVREYPADVGLAPYGAEPAADPAPATARDADGLSYGDALKTTTFWGIAIAAMTTFYGILGAQAHMILYLRSLGMTPAGAASGLSMLFVLGLVGKFVFGMLADTYDKKRVTQLNLLVMWAGTLALASMSPRLVWPAILLFGFGWGGVYTLLQVLCMSVFGLRAGGKLLGTVTVLDAIGGGLGTWLTGLLFDRTGSYGLPFGIIAALVAVGLVVTSLLVNVAPAASGAGGMEPLPAPAPE